MEASPLAIPCLVLIVGAFMSSEPACVKSSAAVLSFPGNLPHLSDLTCSTTPSLSVIASPSHLCWCLMFWTGC